MGGGEGVLVNIGYMDMASGEEQPLSENITEEPVIEKADPPKQEEAKIITQETEEAPVVETKKPKPEVKKPAVTPVVKPAVKPAPKPQPERTADQKALYKGKTTTSTSQGTGTGQGDQGNPFGDPASNQYGKPGSGNGPGSGGGTGSGSGSGNDGFTFDLSGRSFKRKPELTDNTQEQGKVVVNIVVDKYGKVVSAVGPGRGSTTTNTTLVKKAEEAAKRAQFNPSPQGVEEQRGSITFNFVLN